MIDIGFYAFWAFEGIILKYPTFISLLGGRASCGISRFRICRCLKRLGFWFSRFEAGFRPVHGAKDIFVMWPKQIVIPWRRANTEEIRVKTLLVSYQQLSAVISRCIGFPQLKASCMCSAKPASRSALERSSTQSTQKSQHISSMLSFKKNSFAIY